MKNYKSIIVGTENNELKIHANPDGYELIGVGYTGAVFKITHDRCVKIFYRSELDRIAEEKALLLLQGSSFFPKVFETGEYYIVMEYIEGIDLKQYLIREKELPSWITLQILKLLNEMKHLNLTRHDARLRHIILLEEKKSIKVIDHVNSLKDYKPYPKQLFKGLSNLGFFDIFITQVKEYDKELYNKWKQMGKIKKYKNDI